jgi:3(or 17)beta-hydroxysteroid dehydrogenase
MNRLQAKVALVTGGAGGIGEATARLFAAEGARVVIADVAEEQGRALARGIGGEFLRLDVTDEQQWADVVRGIDEHQGGPHVLVNAAGIEGNLEAGTPESTSYAEWRRVHAVNLDGTFLGCRAVLPVMKRLGAGSIVNISSIVAYFGSPLSVSYGSSKAAVQQLTKSVALHGSRDGKRVRCNSVHPGVIRTRMLRDIYATIARNLGISPKDAERANLRAVPFGEVGEPRDVAYLNLYLASDESRYVTGSEFQVDGGWHLVDAR